MKKKLAFTFIEVIIAITVFAIGVLAVLRLITQNLAMLDLTQMRTTATFLAKEGIELVYNMRDSNLQKSLPWDCILDTTLTGDDFGIVDEHKFCMWYFASGTTDGNLLQIAFSPQGYVFAAPKKASDTFSDLWNDNRLYYTRGTIGGHQLFWYSYDADVGTPTVFARYIRFVPVREGSDILPVNNILKIESHVSYSKGTKTGEVILESFIGKY